MTVSNLAIFICSYSFNMQKETAIFCICLAICPQRYNNICRFFFFFLFYRRLFVKTFTENPFNFFLKLAIICFSLTSAKITKKLETCKF